MNFTVDVHERENEARKREMRGRDQQPTGWYKEEQWATIAQAS